jgi:hypothetical protein
MKRKLLFTGIFSIMLIFMMVLAGCESEYDGPNVYEIADTVLEQTELRICAQFIEDLTAFGKLSITKGIQAWNQNDAAYTLTINTAERTSFDLPRSVYNTVEVLLAWEGTGNSDIKRSDYRISITEKADGKTAAFNFTFTNMITSKTIKGVLTVNTIFDHTTVGVIVLNEFFSKVLSSFGTGDYTSTLTTNKPITNWGQSDVAYTIDAKTNVQVCFPTIQAPILYDNDIGVYGDWKSVLVEWKPLTVTSELTSSYTTDDDDIHITHYSVNYSYKKSIINLTSDLGTSRQVVMNFRISNDDQVISGTVTINIIKGTSNELSPAEKDRIELQSLRDEFYLRLQPLYNISSSTDTYRLTCYVDNSINNFGQTDVLYLITVRGNSGGDDGDSVKYSNLDLPYMSGAVTWTTKTSDPAVSLSGSTLKVFNNKTGIAEFSFIYTSPASSTKTVKGTVKITVVK